MRDLPRREQERHPLLIAAVIPTGSFRAANQLQYMAAVRACPSFVHYRSDGLETLLAIAQVLCDHMDWDLGTTRPGWAQIMHRTGRSRRTVARYLRALHEAGLAATVASGRIGGLEPLDPTQEAGNAAAVYVLTVPHGLRLIAGGRTPSPTSGALDSRGHSLRADVRQGDELVAGDIADQAAEHEPSISALNCADSPVDENGTPSLTLLGSAGSNPTRARARDIRGLGPADLVAGGSWWMAGVAPTKKQDRLLAAAELRRVEPILRRPGTSTAAVAAAVREWHLASVPSTTGQDQSTGQGWLISDIRYAINHRPDGTPHPHQLTVADVRHPIAWMMYRLDFWRETPGDRSSPPGLAPSQRTVQAGAAVAAAHAAQAAADQETRAAAVAPTAVAGWEAARTQQRARAAAARAQNAADRRLTLVPPAVPADPASDTNRLARSSRAAVRRSVTSVGTGRRPVHESTDPRIAALRAAVRIGRRP